MTSSYSRAGSRRCPIAVPIRLRSYVSTKTERKDEKPLTQHEKDANQVGTARHAKVGQIGNEQFAMT